MKGYQKWKRPHLVAEQTGTGEVKRLTCNLTALGWREHLLLFEFISFQFLVIKYLTFIFKLNMVYLLLN